MGLKQRLRNYSLKKLEKQFGDNSNYSGFSKIKRIAIVFEQSESAERAVSDFVKKLTSEGKQLNMLTYIPKKRKEILEYKAFDYFCKDDVNWYGKPKPEAVSGFTKEQYDVLITLNDKTSPVQFITLSTKADFTVGLSSSDLSVLDLQVAKPENGDYASVFKEVDYYLRFINKAD